MAQEAKKQNGVDKLCSNITIVADILFKVLEEVFIDDESVKLLSMTWLAILGRFSIARIVIPERLEITKRVVLSIKARLFILLEFLTLHIMFAKVLFQNLWRLSLAWDGRVPVDVQRDFSKWIQSMEKFRSWLRCIDT